MNKRIVFCNCKGKLIDSERITEIISYMNKQGISFLLFSDLCGICATQKDKIRGILNDCNEILMIACFPRAVKLLLNESGTDTRSKSITFLNVRDTDNKTIFEKINNFSDNEVFNSPTEEIISNPEWSPWFPVIDYSRCSSCGQCADFCLFGVYEKKDGKVFVLNPQGCKDNCPACGRICPQTAIVFPKYEHGGAIAGADSFDEIEEQQRQQQDINTILGSDIYNSLEQRKLKRRSIIRNSEMKNALLEREKALSERENK